MTKEVYRRMHGVVDSVVSAYATPERYDYVKSGYLNTVATLRAVILSNNEYKHSADLVVSKAPVLALLDELMSYSSCIVDPAKTGRERPSSDDVAVARSTINRLIRYANGESGSAFAVISPDEAVNLDTLFSVAYPDA